jgi:hypothetical protein
MTLARYALGPFPLFLCQVDYLLKNILTLEMVIGFSFVLVVRYIFVFHSKNPTAVQDDFWNLFINMWAYSKFLVS